jgi:hypothetical protein
MFGFGIFSLLKMFLESVYKHVKNLFSNFFGFDHEVNFLNFLGAFFRFGFWLFGFLKTCIVISIQTCRGLFSKYLGFDHQVNFFGFFRAHFWKAFFLIPFFLIFEFFLEFVYLLVRGGGLFFCFWFYDWFNLKKKVLTHLLNQSLTHSLTHWHTEHTKI